MAILRNSVDDPYFSDLWLRDVDRESEIRKTFDGRIDEAGNVVWSPGGDKVVFTADPQKTGNLDLYWMDVLSVSTPSLLLESEHPLYASDWSYNGEYLVYSEYHPDRQADLWYVPIPNGKVGEPVPFLQTDFIESAGQLSPDGRWIAYVSNDTGSSAVYVRQFPSGAGVWKISGSAASTQPRWSPSGDELFFLEGVSPNVRVMTSRVSDKVLARGETPFEPATLLFRSTINSFHPATGTSFYTVTPDGQSFIVNHLRTDREPVVNFVTNWRNAFEVPAD
jgi:Tol biopolymer transport system component